MHEKIASQLLEKIKSTVQENPKTLAALVAGAGVGGLAGGVASAGKHDEKENKSERRMRILRNALLSGAAGAGAAGLGVAGYNQLSHALPADDTDPATGLFTSPAGRGVMAGGLGGAGWMMGKGKREGVAAGLLRPVGVDSQVGGSARETLRNIMQRGTEGHESEAYRSLMGSPDTLRQGLMRSGLDPYTFGAHNYRLSDKLPEGARDMYRKGTGFVADKLKKIPGIEKLPLEGMSNARQTLSRAVVRHPGVSGLVAAGLLAPEMISTGTSLASPVLPNPFHRND